MTFRNFELIGEQALFDLAEEKPIPCERLIFALEAFVSGGAAYGTLVAYKGKSAAPQSAVYLVPLRYILRSVPDAAALVTVDFEMQTLELAEVMPVYGGPDEKAWAELSARADDLL